MMNIRKIKTSIIVVGPRLYLIVTDPMAGRQNRYTVHQVSLTGFKGTKVVGRELPLGFAKRLIQKLEAAHTL